MSVEGKKILVGGGTGDVGIGIDGAFCHWVTP